MGNLDRIYKYQRIENHKNLDISQVYLPIDSGQWKREKALTLKQIGDILQVFISDGIFDENVISVDSNNISPNRPPKGLSKTVKTYISVDEDYLYVWIPNKNMWKRTRLLDWD